MNTSMQCPRYIRMAEKSVKRGLNLQDLLYLTIFIYIIYLLTILLRFRLPGLKSIYLLREHHIKSVAESSYSLLRGREFSLQMSLPGDIPDRVAAEACLLFSTILLCPSTTSSRIRYLSFDLQLSKPNPSPPSSPHSQAER
jgi:hypothetical protein